MGSFVKLMLHVSLVKYHWPCMVAEKEPTVFTVHLFVANRCVIKTGSEIRTFSGNVGADRHLFHRTGYFKELSLKDFFSGDRANRKTFSQTTSTAT